MKRLPEILAAVALAVTAVTACRAVTFATEREPNPHLNYYPDAGIVQEVHGNGVIVIRNSFGDEYAFKGLPGYSVGDVVAVLMDNNDTPGNPLDDLVIDARIVWSVGND